MQNCLDDMCVKLYIIYDSVIVDFLNKNNRFTSHTEI